MTGKGAIALVHSYI